MIYLDTNILIDALRGYSPATLFFSEKSRQDRLSCSRVTEIELLLGAPSAELRRPVDRLLKDLDLLTPTEADFNAAVVLFRRYFLRYHTEFFDCLVAATALRLNLEVYTRNARHLRPISGLRVVVPYR